MVKRARPAGHRIATDGHRISATAGTERPQTCTLRPDIHDQLLAWHEQGFAGTAIRDGLRQAFGEALAPHLNTVYAEIKRHAADRSGAWTLAEDDYDAATARLVLEELAAVIEQSGGRRRYVTRREAWWIARLKSIHTDTPLAPGEAFAMARLHTAAEQRGEQLSAWLDIIEPPLARLHASTGHRELFAPKETR